MWPRISCPVPFPFRTMTPRVWISFWTQNTCESLLLLDEHCCHPNVLLGSNHFILLTFSAISIRTNSLARSQRICSARECNWYMCKLDLPDIGHNLMIVLSPKLVFIAGQFVWRESTYWNNTLLRRTCADSWGSVSKPKNPDFKFCYFMFQIYSFPLNVHCLHRPAVVSTGIRSQERSLPPLTILRSSMNCLYTLAPPSRISISSLFLIFIGYWG